MSKPVQFEIPTYADVFNLAIEAGDDPLRLEMDRLRVLREQELAREYQAKMQRQLAECPGFIGADPGKVVVEPARISEAITWLKKRFHVNESLELSTDTGLCVEIQARHRRKLAGEKRAAPHFGKVEQFELSLK